ncbi:MAG: GNAT family N-acetyltransferase [Promethearchaeota archaeon]
MSSLSAKYLTAKHKKTVHLITYPSLLIGRLAVNNEYRRKGIGKYISDWCLGLAMKLSNKVGCRYIILETTEKIVKFYKKCNFEKGKVLEEEQRKLIWMYQRISLE